MDVILCLHSPPPTIKVKAKFLIIGEAIDVFKKKISTIHA